MHSVRHLLNDWGLEFKHKGGKFVFQENIQQSLLQKCYKEEAKKKGPKRGMQDGGGGSGLDPLFHPKIECN